MAARAISRVLLCLLSFAACTQAAYSEAHAGNFTACLYGCQAVELVFISSTLVIGSILQYILSAYRLPLPYTSLLLLVGVVIGIIEFAVVIHEHSWLVSTHYLVSVFRVSNMDPHLILHLFLPPLIFESSFSIEWHLFKMTGLQSLTVATVGLLVATFATAGVLYLLFPHWDYLMYILCGALLSATDPVAVVALLKDMGAPGALSAFIEGESLLNDGTAVVIFNVIIIALRDGSELNISEVVGTFFLMSCGGAAVGLVMGFLVVSFMVRVFNNALVEISMSIAAAYLCFYIAEAFFSVSGVIAVVVFGLYFGSVGRTAVSPEVEHFLHEFWELLGFMANTIIFTLTGVIITEKGVESSELLTAQSILKVFGLYIALTFIRMFSLVFCYPLLRKIGYGIDMNHLVVSCWGGLRGAVGLALALVVNHETIELDPSSPEYARKVAQNSDVLLATSGIVFLTLVINALSMPKLCSYLGIDSVTQSKKKLFDEAMQQIELAGKHAEQHIQLDPLFSGANWKRVRQYQFTKPHLSVKKASRTVDVYDIGKAENEEARRRLLVGMKASYWNQFKEGVLGRQAVRELIEITDQVLDQHCKLQEWRVLHNMITVSGTSKIAHRLLHVPLVNRVARRYLFNRLKHGYDCVTSFVSARKESLDGITKTLMKNFDKTAFKTLEEQVTEDITVAKSTLMDIQKYLPEIASSIATSAAAKQVLNTQRKEVKKLLYSGILDIREAAHINGAIEEQLQRLLHVPPSMSLPNKTQLLFEVPWLSHLNERARQMIIEKTKEELFDEGEIIVREGDYSFNMYIVARGIVEIFVKDADGEGLRRQDSISSGSFVGELCWLTHKPRVATAIAASPVICFLLRGKDILEISKHDPSIQAGLLHSAACRLTVMKLMEIPPYDTWQKSVMRKWVFTKWELFTSEMQDLSVTFKQPVYMVSGKCLAIPHKTKKLNKRQLTRAINNADDDSWKSVLVQKIHDIGKMDTTVAKLMKSVDPVPAKKASKPDDTETDDVVGTTMQAPCMIQEEKGTYMTVIFSLGSSVLISPNSIVTSFLFSHLKSPAEEAMMQSSNIEDDDDVGSDTILKRSSLRFNLVEGPTKPNGL